MNVVGIGVDVESTVPFREKKWPKDKAFLTRVFSDAEIEYCRKFSDPAPHFTARFCAKEALVKAASSVAKLFVSDMEVTHDKNGAPLYRARTKRPQTRTFFAKHQIWLSLSHTRDQAIAFAVVAKGKKKNAR